MQRNRGSVTIDDLLSRSIDRSIEYGRPKDPRLRNLVSFFPSFFLFSLPLSFYSPSREILDYADATKARSPRTPPPPPRPTSLPASQPASQPPSRSNRLFTTPCRTLFSARPSQGRTNARASVYACTIARYRKITRILAIMKSSGRRASAIITGSQPYNLLRA